MQIEMKRVMLVNYYQSLFTYSNVPITHELDGLITSEVIEEENIYMTQTLTAKEIYDTLKATNLHKSLGPNAI